MGHKKHPPALNRKPETPPSRAATMEGIKREYERALTTLQRGNHSKALRIMKESTPKFDNTAAFHRVAGTISMKVAMTINDTTVKRKHLKQALESAKKASKLSPNSLMNAHFYANMLIEQSEENPEFDEVVAVCERALAVEKPYDPALDLFVGVTDYSAEAVQVRVARVQSDLRVILRQANTLSLSSWTPVVDDPLEGRVNAIARTLERTDINEGNADADADADDHVEERMDSVRSFWNSMSYEMKRGLLKIKITDLRETIERSSDNGGSKAVKVFTGALLYYLMHNTWKFLECCHCWEGFTDGDEHMHHVLHEHLDELPPELQSVVPHRPDKAWQEMLFTCRWEPLKVTPLGRPLEDLSKLSGREARKGETSDDAERAKLLKKISSLFQGFVRRKCLAKPLLETVIRYTMDELHKLFPGSPHLSLGIEQTPMCICFLGASSLEKVANLLQTVSNNLGAVTSSEEDSEDDIDDCPPNSDSQQPEVLLTVDETASFILLDETLLLLDSVRHDTGSTSSVDGFEKGGQSDSGLLSWIYSASPKYLAKWSKINDKRSEDGFKLLESLDDEFTKLRSLCEKKLELLEYRELLQGKSDRYLERCKKGEQRVDISFCNYESFLRKSRDEIVEVDNAAASESKLKAFKLHTVTLELNKLDAKIMCKVEDTNQLKLKLHELSVFDYCFILMPLMQLYIQERLEELAEKDAIERSAASAAA